MKNNNKIKNFLLIVYCLLGFLIIISSFGTGLFKYFMLGFTYLFSFFSDDLVLIQLIVEYFLYFCFYAGLGVISFYLFMNYFEEIKYILIYAMITNIAILVLSMLIKSFYELEIEKYFFKEIFNLLGIYLAFYIEYLKNKRNKSFN